MKNKPNILIAGAGLAGLSTAYFLEQKKRDYMLLDRDSLPGGLCKTIKLNGYMFDYSGHLLHIADKRVEVLIKKLLNTNLKKHNRKSWIYSSNTYTPYPFQSHTYGLPAKVRKECLFGFINAYYSRRNGDSLFSTDNFDKWVRYYFGDGIAKYFMYPYNEKLWTIKAKNLTTSWMSKYVPNPSLEDVIDGTFSEDIANVGYNASFYYPKKNGIGSLVDGFVNNISEDKINLNTKLDTVNIKKKQVVIDGKILKYDKLITSIPLRDFVLKILSDAPERIKKSAKLLASNTVMNVNLGISRSITDKHWVYFPEEKYCFYRVGFNSNFANDIAPKGCTSIYTEVSSKKYINKNEYLGYIKKIVADLIKARILSKHDDIDVALPLVISPAYVIYDKYRDECVGEILKFLEDNDIYSIGRYGKWEYSAMQDAILDGMNVVDKL